MKYIFFKSIFSYSCFGNFLIHFLVPQWFFHFFLGAIFSARLSFLSQKRSCEWVFFLNPRVRCNFAPLGTKFLSFWSIISSYAGSVSFPSQNWLVYVTKTNNLIGLIWPNQSDWPRVFYANNWDAIGMWLGCDDDAYRCDSTQQECFFYAISTQLGSTILPKRQRFVLSGPGA